MSDLIVSKKTEQLNSSTKKLSKRQRLSQKQKLTKVQAQKIKKKRPKRRNKTKADNTDRGASTPDVINADDVTRKRKISENSNGIKSKSKKTSENGDNSDSKKKTAKEIDIGSEALVKTKGKDKSTSPKVGNGIISQAKKAKNISEKNNCGDSKSKEKTSKKSKSNMESPVKAKKKMRPFKTKKKKELDNGDTTEPSLAGVELDKNWKELSQKLGIGSNKSREKTDHKKNEEKIPEKQQESGKEVWFDDVEDMFIEQPKDESISAVKGPDELADISDQLIKSGTKAVLTKSLAMDCEMVGVGPGGEESVLARISVVNQYGHCVYDKFVKSKEEVTDYRTWVSGVRAEDLAQAESLETVQNEVNEMFKGRILVGHAITNDEKVLFMNHPKKYVRDTQKYPGFRQLVGGRKPGLKLLSEKVLGVKIQSGEHSSVQDAQATMRLYTLIRKDWEKKIKEKYRLNKHRREKLAGKSAGNSKPTSTA